MSTSTKSAPSEQIDKSRAPWIKTKARQASAIIKSAWGILETKERALLILAVLAIAASCWITIDNFRVGKLSEPYALIEKSSSAPLLAVGEKVSSNPRTSFAVLKADPDGSISLFVNAASANGSVESLVIIRSLGGAYPYIALKQERELLVSYMKERDRLDRVRILDYENLSAADKLLVQGLAVKLGPPDSKAFDNAEKALMALINFAFMGAMAFMVVQMVAHGRKRVRFLRPAQITGSMSELIGMEDIKAEVLRTKNFLEDRESYHAYGINRPTNILFSGPPGTGKTKLAGYLAKELGLPILFHSAANLETGFVNGGSQTLERILALAKKEKRCLVFLDEAQDLFMRRGQGSRKFDDDTQNNLLSILDGVRTTNDSEIIWIVASNFNSNTMQMDEAMLRRFQLKIDLRLPNRQERRDIFQFYLSKAPGKVDPDLDLDSSIHLTERCSPADIETIVYEAGVAAMGSKSLIGTGTIMRATERTLIGNTDTETTEGREREREIIALHEVGHFLIDAVRHGGPELSDPVGLRDKVGAIKISLKANARTNALGFVFKKPRENMLMTKSDLSWDVRTLFGGMANEEIFFGEDGVTTGAHNDIQEITKLLNHAVASMGLFKPSKLNFAALAPSSHHVEPSKDDRELMEGLSAKLYAEAKDMLARHKDLSRHLADTLMSSVEMSADEMLAQIAKFHARAPALALAA